jgi:hypothetical protein
MCLPVFLVAFRGAADFLGMVILPIGLEREESAFVQPASIAPPGDVPEALITVCLSHAPNTRLQNPSTGEVFQTVLPQTPRQC